MTDVVGNGIRAEDGRYAIEPASYADFADLVAADPPESEYGRGPLGIFDPESLDEVGWGVVVAADDPEAPARLAALEPVLDRRRRQADTLYRDDLVYYAGMNASRFLAVHGGPPATVDPRRIPYYLLLVGDADLIPFDFQHQLASIYAVGRLAFATNEEYANYAAGVLACEEREIRRRQQMDFFVVRNPGDEPTRLAGENLVDPLLPLLAAEVTWKTCQTTGEEASKARLLELLADPSAFLFTSSHGILYSAASRVKREREGALLCGDWPGPSWQGGYLPDDFFVAARDIPEDLDLRGLVTFFFACNSAGTPRLDSYSRAAEKTRSRPAVEAPRSFVAALPQRLLGLPRGALAAIGHADGIWPLSYRWSGGVPDTGHFEALFRLLMRHKRIGHALDGFGQRSTTIASRITDALDARRNRTTDHQDPLATEKGQVFLWTAHQDARSYVLLGDPAVRLVSNELEP